MRVSVNFFFEKTSFRIKKKTIIASWIKTIVTHEKKRTGTICFIFCDDSSLADINTQYLNRENYTDVIAFDYSEGNRVSGDIYISIERVEENAGKFKIPFIEELFRVMAHGVLHLTGYSDSDRSEKLDMTLKENIYIKDIYNKYL
ncbi:MAG: rRNA maturation RNase YbeY [Bacteroidota bacterium]